MAPRSISRPVVVAAAFLSVALAAQQPLPQPSPEQSTVPVIAPTPVPSATPVPPPVALATPTLTPRPGIDDVPTPVFVPNPRPTPTSAPPAQDAAPAAAPTALPTIAPIPTLAATSPIRPPIETVILPQQAPAPLWPWFVGGAALLLVLLGWIGLRRQRADRGEEAYDQASMAESVIASDPSMPAAEARARLIVALRPIRAGLNLISATAECEVTVVNAGGATARDVHAFVRLSSARDGQEAELATFYAQAGGRPAAAFALAPGEARRFRAVTALPHDAIHPIDAGGRPMFVPVLALSVRYRDDEGPRGVGQAFVVGVDQGDAAKLVPLWLDGPARTYDNVAARPHGEAVER